MTHVLWLGNRNQAKSREAQTGPAPDSHLPFGVCFYAFHEPLRGAFMPLSRRGFLRSATIAAAASAVLELPALAVPVQVEAAHRGDIPPNAIKLSNNENAYGPSPRS